ncbi:hypothetical protein MTO96_042393, partial [Rhipicephalus appendiculatus]
ETAAFEGCEVNQHDHGTYNYTYTARLAEEGGYEGPIMRVKEGVFSSRTYAMIHSELTEHCGIFRTGGVTCTVMVWHDRLNQTNTKCDQWYRKYCGHYTYTIYQRNCSQIRY